jgi:phage tail-like protein
MIRPPSLQAAANPRAAVSGLTVASSKRTPDTAPKYGMTMWFNVWVPDLDGRALASLGSWSGCSGLTVKLTPEGPMDAGGSYGSQLYLPGKVSYPEVTLERAMTYTGTRRVRKWLEDQTEQWAEAKQVYGPRQPVVIELRSGLGPKAEVVHRWELQDAIPVSWTVPALSTSGSGAIAIEKLTLAHSGFLKRVEPLDGCRLELVEKDDDTQRLWFLCNPAKFSVTKSRESESKSAKIKQAGTLLVDPNSLSATLSDLRLEGTGAIKNAIPVLRRWLELNDAPKRAGAAPIKAEETNPNECPKCKKKKASAADDTAAGEAKVLKVLWGNGHGGLPAEMILKSFTLNYSRFTPAGEPSRANLTLILQEPSERQWVKAIPRDAGAPRDPERSSGTAGPMIGSHRPLGAGVQPNGPAQGMSGARS